MSKSKNHTYQIEQVDIQKLIPYANNAKLHSEKQVSQIASSIREFGFNNPVLIDSENGIIAGHGRVLAARKLDLEQVPCIRLVHLTDNQRKAYILADNRLAETGGGWDEEILKLEIKAIEWSDLEEIGIDDFEFSEIEFGESEESSEKTNNPYTAKIETPVYQVTGETPDVSDLMNLEKYNVLLQAISKSAVSSQQKEFLKFAAARHIVFNYQQIAEFYAHADKELQQLMEDSALVIVDFNKAIEKGFVKLTDSIAEQFGVDFPTEEDDE
jgi:hypothetical protein